MFSNHLRTAFSSYFKYLLTLILKTEVMHRYTGATLHRLQNGQTAFELSTVLVSNAKLSSLCRYAKM